MRGRLIFPFRVFIARVDPASIADAGPGGEDGFDDDFREPTLEQVSGREVPVRRELDSVMLAAQIEPGTFDGMEMLAQGNSPRGDMQISISHRVIEDAGLVDDNGRATLRAGDRLVKIEGDLTRFSYHVDPPLYIESTTADSWGLGSGRPNLLVVSLTDRPQGVRARQP